MKEPMIGLTKAPTPKTTSTSDATVSGVVNPSSLPIRGDKAISAEIAVIK
jgi:hypothetical protein